MTDSNLRERYVRDGYVAAVRIVSEAQAARHRAAMEQAEARAGPLHYRDKVHTILRSPLALATHPAMLDVVEALIGPDILLYNACFIVKEARSASRVSWHQDLTYWGFDSDAVVSAWLALSPATEQSGCMMMLPGSHRRGRCAHVLTQAHDNLLVGGQTVAGIDESRARHCPLRPGEASFHHGWLLHASSPNHSSDRRIGLNIQYLAPGVRQTVCAGDSAMLVRGRDEYGHYAQDVPAQSDLDPAAIARQRSLQARIKAIYQSAMRA